jgi:Spy/CpxP family protein refolding chaperone
MTRPNLKSLVVVALALAAASPVFAQGNAPAAGADASSPSNPQANGQVGFQRRQQLSPQDELLEGDRTIARMEGASALIRSQLGKARAERDVVKTLCLNDKLSQADVAVRSGRDRNSALKEAVGRNDSELSNHEFTILSVLGQRSQQLTAEANQCIGEEATTIGQTQISREVDPTLPPNDETDRPPYDNIVPLPGDVPSCTTCSR